MDAKSSSGSNSNLLFADLDLPPIIKRGLFRGMSNTRSSMCWKCKQKKNELIPDHSCQMCQTICYVSSPLRNEQQDHTHDDLDDPEKEYRDKVDNIAKTLLRLLKDLLPHVSDKPNHKLIEST